MCFIENILCVFRNRSQLEVAIITKHFSFTYALKIYKINLVFTFRFDINEMLLQFILKNIPKIHT